MQTRRLFVFALLALVWGASDAHAQKAVLIVRHAEKVDESTDAALSAAGLQRAEALARHLESAGVSAIFTTQFQRTIKTAAPLAQILKLAMTSGAMSSAELVRTLRAKHPDEVVLVVGHSNTVPDILKQLGHPQTVDIGPQEFGNLFVVVPRPSGPPTVLRLRY